MSAHHRDLSRRWFAESWNDRNDQTVDELIHPDCLGHMESGEVIGAAPFRQVRDAFLAALPDLKIKVEDVVSDGDDVVVRWSGTGTHTGEGLGLEPTGRSVSVKGMTWHRYRDGRMVEAWDSWNQDALFQSLADGPEEQRRRRTDQRGAIAGRLREIRAELFGEDGGPEMARQLNIPARTLYNYETGVTIPGEILLEIIELTGVRPLWLLKGEEPRYGEKPSPPAEG